MTEQNFGPVGGNGGEAFATVTAPEGAHITAVHVWSGLFIDNIQFVYRDAAGQETTTDRVGGHSGIHHHFALEADETLVGISGRHAHFIDSLRLHTNKRDSESYGGWGGTTEYSISAPEGAEIVGFIGRAGWYIDALGIVTRAQATQPAAASAAPATKGRKPKAAPAAEAAPAAVLAPVVASEVAPAKAKTGGRKPKATPAAEPVATPVAEAATAPAEQKAKRASRKAAPAAAPAVEAETRSATIEVSAPAAKTPNAAELEKIEGIGPKLAQTLIANGINDLTDLAATSVERLKEILASAGARYKLADPTTWPEQAALGAQGDWEGFAKLQSELKSGRRR